MLEGLLWGVLFYLLSLFMALWIYGQYSIWYKKTLLVILLCWLGHFIGTYAYTFILSDSSTRYFPGATPEFTSTGTAFVKNLVWYVREAFTGDNYVGTLYFFSAFASLGSVLWYCLYLQISQWLKIENQLLVFPALVIMCWPTFFFFTSGLGKDSLCFFLIPLVLICWSQLFYKQQYIPLMLILLFFSLLLMTLLRPYLLMLFIGAFYFSTFTGFKNLTFLRFLSLLVLIPIVLYVIQWVAVEQGGMSAEAELDDVTNRALTQQERLNKGTSFPILSHNPAIVLLTLPYGMLMNLIMPLFVLANNIQGIASSVENCFLLWLLFRFWKDRAVFRHLRAKYHIIKFCFNYFLVGIMFLGLINTNLGLSARQKSMYLPAFLIVAMIVWLYKKQNKHL